MRGGLAVSVVLISFLILVSGCTTTYADYGYEVAVDADGEATVYIPVAMDADTGEIADLVSEMKVVEKEGSDTEVDYGVVSTRYGRALKIRTTGDVKLNATADEGYLEKHPAQTAAGGYPHFFNVSMKADTRGYRPQSSIPHYAKLETEDTSEVSVFIDLHATNKQGTESWNTDLDTITLRPGWNKIKISWNPGIF